MSHRRALQSADVGPSVRLVAIQLVLSCHTLVNIVDLLVCNCLLSGCMRTDTNWQQAAASQRRKAEGRCCAGYGWQGGWYAEAALQLASLIHSAAGAWVCLATLLSAFFGFAWTLARLYRSAPALGRDLKYNGWLGVPGFAWNLAYVYRRSCRGCYQAVRLVARPPRDIGWGCLARLL